MENLPFILVLLACPIGMGLMMLFMGMGHGDKHDPDMKTAEPTSADPEKRLAILHARRRLLDAQIDAASAGAASPPLQDSP